MASRIVLVVLSLEFFRIIHPGNKMKYRFAPLGIAMGHMAVTIVLGSL